LIDPMLNAIKNCTVKLLYKMGFLLGRVIFQIFIGIMVMSVGKARRHP